MTAGLGPRRTLRGRRPHGRGPGAARLALSVAGVALGLLAGCGGSGSSTPTLDADTSISLSAETLVPIPGGLCHVKGRIQNLSPVRVDVTLQWQALNSDGKELGTTSLTIENVLPGETRPFETTGFITSDSVIACPKIDTFPVKLATVKQA